MRVVFFVFSILFVPPSSSIHSPPPHRSHHPSCADVSMSGIVHSPTVPEAFPLATLPPTFHFSLFTFIPHRPYHPSCVDVSMSGIVHSPTVPKVFPLATLPPTFHFSLFTFNSLALAPPYLKSYTYTYLRIYLCIVKIITAKQSVVDKTTEI